MASAPRTAGHRVGSPTAVKPQVNGCWVAENNGLIEAVKRFIDPACRPIHDGPAEPHLQYCVEIQLRVRDLIRHESVQPRKAGSRVHLLHLLGDLLHVRTRIFGAAEHELLSDGVCECQLKTIAHCPSFVKFLWRVKAESELERE
jgi:hypothetical protein